MKKILLAAFVILVGAARADAQVSAQVLPPSDPVSITANGGEVCWGVNPTMASIAIRVYGTFTGTVAPRVRIGSATNLTPPSGAISASSLTAAGILTITNQGWMRVCMVATAWTSGEAQFSAVAGGGNPGGSGGGGGSGDASLSEQQAQTTLLTAIDGRVDGLETLIGTTNTTLSTIDGRVDGLETLIGTTNTNTGNTVSSLQVIDDLVKSEDAAHVSAEAGIGIFGVRRDTTPSSSSGTAGDYSLFNLDANGRLYTNTVIYNSGGTELTAAVDGTFDSAVPTTGPAILFRAETTSPSAVADGDAVYPMADLYGRLYAIPGADHSSVSAGTDCTVVSTASTNATNCKASGGNVYGYEFINTTATLAYVRFYNLATAPTCSSATGFIRSVPVPASTTGAGIVRTMSVPVNYGTGMGFCITGGGTSTDASNAPAGVYVNVVYK